MTLEATLRDVWKQALEEERTSVVLEGATYNVGRTRAQGLRTVGFVFAAHKVEGIEQNPRTTSRWAKLAQEGKRIMQFTVAQRYVANVCEGVVTHYPAWQALGLPE